MDLREVIQKLTIGECLTIGKIDTPGDPWTQIKFSKEYNNHRVGNRINMNHLELELCKVPEIMVTSAIETLIDKTREACK